MIAARFWTVAVQELLIAPSTAEYLNCDEDKSVAGGQHGNRNASASHPYDAGVNSEIRRAGFRLADSVLLGRLPCARTGSSTTDCKAVEWRALQRSGGLAAQPRQLPRCTAPYGLSTFTM